MKLKTMLVAAAALVIPVSALAETAPTPADKANASTTCAALRTSMGASFATTYRTFGACVSQHASEEKRNRIAAAAACKAEQPDGTKGELQRCAAAKLRAARAAERTTTVNAARKCKAERTQLGAAPFATKYGGAANAFGKCVSKLAQAQQDAQAEQG